MKKILKLTWPVALASIVLVLLWYTLHFVLGVPTIKHETIAKLNDGDWLVYVLVAALVLQNAWQRIQKMQGAINKEDKEQFFSLLKSNIPPVLYVFIGYTAFYLLLNFLMSDYEGIFEGVYSIFQVSFILIIFYQTLFEVINVFDGLWKLDCSKMPSEWKTDVEKYLESKKMFGILSMHHFDGHNGLGLKDEKIGNKGKEDKKKEEDDDEVFSYRFVDDDDTNE